MSADLAQVDELIVHRIPYQGDPLQPTDVWIAPISAPVAGDMIVSDADWATLLAWAVTDMVDPFRTIDYLRGSSPPFATWRVWQLNVDAPLDNALATEIGIAVDAATVSTPTLMTWLQGSYNPLAPTRTSVGSHDPAELDAVGGICSADDLNVGGKCDGWLPRDPWDAGVDTPVAHPPLPDGTIGGDGQPVPGSTSEQAPAHVPLGSDDVNVADYVDDYIDGSGGGGGGGDTGPPGPTGPTGPTGPAGPSFFPQALTIFPWQYRAHSSHWEQFANDILALGGRYWSTYGSTGTTNVGEYIEFDALLEAGSWRIKWGAFKTADAGILSIKLDGTVVGTWDGWNAGGLQYALTTDPSGAKSPDGRPSLDFTVPTTGNHTIRFQVTGKNAGSSGYEAYLMAFDLLRLGA